MPKQKSKQMQHDSDYTDSEYNSDVEDYCRGFGGLTKREALSGKRFEFPTPTKTAIFKHALRNQYCSKSPPTLPTFINLIETLGFPLLGRRYSEKCISAIASWVTNNVSSTNLGELMVEAARGSIGNRLFYEIYISPAVRTCVEQAEFTYTDILALSYPDSPINQQHAQNHRVMEPFGLQDGESMSWNQLVRESLSLLTSTGRIMSSKNASVNISYYSQPYASSGNSGPQQGGAILPGYHYGIATTNNAMPPAAPAALPSASPQPLYEVDRNRLEQNYECWKRWSQWLVEQTEHAQAQRGNGPDVVMPREVQEGVDRFKRNYAFDVTNDYVAWQASLSFNRYT